MTGYDGTIDMDVEMALALARDMVEESISRRLVEEQTARGLRPGLPQLGTGSSNA